LSILKKAVGIGLAASLLAGTMATMLPGTVFAAASVTTLGAGNITAGTLGPTTTLTTDAVLTFAQIGDVVPGVVTVTAPAGIQFWGGSAINFTGGITAVPGGVVSPDHQSIAFTVTGANTAVNATMTFTLTVANTNGLAGVYPIAVTGPFNWLPASQTLANATVVPAAAASLLITPATTTPTPGQVVNVSVQAKDAYGNNTPIGPDNILMTQTSSAGCGTGVFSGLGVWAMAAGVASGTFTVPASAADGCVYTLLGVLQSNAGVVGAAALTVGASYLDIQYQKWTNWPVLPITAPYTEVFAASAGDLLRVQVTVRDATGAVIVANDTVNLTPYVGFMTCPVAGVYGTLVVPIVAGVGATTFAVPGGIVGGCYFGVDGVLASDTLVTGFAGLYVYYGPLSDTEATVTNTAITGIARGGPYAGTGEYRITETYTDSFPTNGFKMYVRIRDYANGNTVHFDTTASSVVLSPSSLGLSAAFVDDSTLVVTSTQSDPMILETLIIGGLKVKADVGAATGAIRTYYSLAHRWNGTQLDDPLSIDFGGKVTATSTGWLWTFFGNTYPAGTTAPTIQLAPGSDPFTDSGGPNGTLDITDVNPLYSESVWINSASDPYFAGSWLQDLNTDPFEYWHVNGTAVSQEHYARNCDTPWGIAPSSIDFVCRLPSIGTVGDALLLSSTSTMIQRGLPNGQLAGMVRIDEQTAKQIPAGTVITVKLDSALGVK